MKHSPNSAVHPEYSCHLYRFAFITLITLSLFACGGGGGSNTTAPPYIPTLYQAIYGAGGYNYTAQFYITGAPDDVDWDRWGMLHDGADYRLYFMKTNSNNTLYQFAYNPSSADYEYAYNSITPITLTNIPPDADVTSLAMSSNITNYYAHMKSVNSPTILHTFRFNGSAYAYERSYNITGAPVETDWSRWAMVYGDGASRFYAGKLGDDSIIYQFKYNASTQHYEWGGSGALSTLAVNGMPTDSNTSDFVMLNNGTQYHFYYLNRQN